MLPPGLVADEEGRRRLGREARALSRLNHPNIATVFDFDADGSVSLIAMEWVPGRTLDQRVEWGGLSEREALAIAIRIAEALIAAHEAGIIRRNLRPANLRLTPDGRLKVLDFDLARRTRFNQAEKTITATQTGARPS